MDITWIIPYKFLLVNPVSSFIVTTIRGKLRKEIGGGKPVMNWPAIGNRIRKQREFIGYTREEFAERLDVTPKFCSDIELGVKGMSVKTLCAIAEVLQISTDYILFGRGEQEEMAPIVHMLENCPREKQPHAEAILREFLLAIVDQ